MEPRPPDTAVRKDPFERAIADRPCHRAIWGFGFNKNIVVLCFLWTDIAQISEQSIAYCDRHRDPGIHIRFFLAETNSTVLPIDVLHLKGHDVAPPHAHFSAEQYDGAVPDFKIAHSMSDEAPDRLDLISRQRYYDGLHWRGRVSESKMQGWG